MRREPPRSPCRGRSVRSATSQPKKEISPEGSCAPAAPVIVAATRTVVARAPPSLAVRRRMWPPGTRVVFDRSDKVAPPPSMRPWPGTVPARRGHRVAPPPDQTSTVGSWRGRTGVPAHRLRHGHRRRDGAPLRRAARRRRSCSASPACPATSLSRTSVATRSRSSSSPGGPTSRSRLGRGPPARAPAADRARDARPARPRLCRLPEPPRSAPSDRIRGGPHRRGHARATWRGDGRHARAPDEPRAGAPARPASSRSGCAGW